MGCHRFKVQIVLIVAALATVLTSGTTADAAWPALKKGDVLVTRNPAWNIVPGYWNHAAIYDGNGNIIEGQISDKDVRRTSLSVFYNRYPQIRVYRLKDQSLVPRLVQYANDLVGRPYTVIPGYGGYSCVMVVRASYYFASLAFVQGGKDPGWLTPDHITRDSRLSYIGQK